MTVIEIFLVLIFISLIAVAFSVWKSGKSTHGSVPLDPKITSAIESLPKIQQTIGALDARIQRLPSDDTVKALDGRLTGLEQRIPNTLDTTLQGLGGSLATITNEYAEGGRFEQIHQATSRVATLLAGGKGRGEAGESLVEQSLKEFPPDMLDRDFKVDGKTVEFALILPNSKRLPIDSKWPKAELITELEQTSDQRIETGLIDKIEKAVIAKAQEVAKYRNPAVTTDVGIAAIPDSAYRVCSKAPARSFRDSSVLVVPYSMVAPYVLAFYNLHLRYGQAIELSNLQAYLSVIEQETKRIDEDLENRVREASTRVNNAYDGIKGSLAKIRAAMEYLKSAPATPSSQSVGEASLVQKAAGD